jgi:glucosamine 6-phosphate synthetase-like amidotransferase/phosphosugar isomerase protein
METAFEPINQTAETAHRAEDQVEKLLHQHKEITVVHRQVLQVVRVVALQLLSAETAQELETQVSVARVVEA